MSSNQPNRHQTSADPSHHRRTKLPADRLQAMNSFETSTRSRLGGEPSGYTPRRDGMNPQSVATPSDAVFTPATNSKQNDGSFLTPHFPSNGYKHGFESPVPSQPIKPSWPSSCTLGSKLPPPTERHRQKRLYELGTGPKDVRVEALSISDSSPSHRANSQSSLPRLEVYARDWRSPNAPATDRKEQTTIAPCISSMEYNQAQLAQLNSQYDVAGTPENSCGSARVSDWVRSTRTVPTVVEDPFTEDSQACVPRTVPQINGADASAPLPPLPECPPPRSAFRPMAALSSSRPSESRVRQDSNVSSSAFSANYLGEHNERNASANDIPPELNCALWFTNLPPDVTYSELLGSIRNIGRIYCSHINKPDFVRHHTAAAKVVFFTPEPAHKLMSNSITHGIFIREYRARVTQNRVRNQAEPSGGTGTRALIITGRDDFVNEKSLILWFRERFVFQLDLVKELIMHVEGRSVMEFRFGSFRCQAQMGKMALERDRPKGFEKVDYGEDPCESGLEHSAFTIAAERIQGRGF